MSHEGFEGRYDGSEIAVVGMAGRFPGAPDLDTFWNNLASGVESIRVFSDEELLAAGVAREALSEPDYVRARPVLGDADLFDAEFFGFSPREAEVLDPQHRVFLEVAWQAFESAGYDLGRYPGTVSAFVGASFSNYLVHNLYKNRPVMEAFGDLESTIQNVQDSLATMLGYKLDLRGLCCAVQTFCSTSLVGVHLACQNLLDLESDMALVGGVTIYVPEVSGYRYAEGSIVSPDGHCRVFDAKAAGTVFGNGAGAVVLKRLEEAMRDGDAIRAVLRGSAVNNDGALKLSFAAPGAKGQSEVIVEALGASGVDPATIGLVEAHGTGTALGDPVEVRALTKAFRTQTDATGYCALGSVKANVGHLDAAAGVTGLIKTILCLENRKIPPVVHFEKPNPELDLEASPFYVPTALRDWPSEGPRRASVSAFGIGGTNAHVILEEAPETRAPAAGSSRPELLILSAKTPAALDRAAGALSEWLRSHPSSALADAAFTLAMGRQAFGHRLALVASSVREAAERLSRGAGVGVHRGAPATEDPPLALVFAGLGFDADAMRDLYTHCPELAKGIDAVDQWLKARGDEGVWHLFAEQPLSPIAVLAQELAFGKQWVAWGVRPQSMRGSGTGSLVAEVLGASVSLEQALELVSSASGRKESSRGARAGAGSESPATPEEILVTIGGEAVVRIDGDTAPSESATRAALAALGRLWLSGSVLDWSTLHAGERRSRIALPTYPFERRRYWIDVEPSEPVMAKREDLASWFYHPCWRTSFAPVLEAERALTRQLLFVDELGVGASLARGLKERGHEVITVRRGDAFEAPESRTDSFRVRPHDREDYDALLDALLKTEGPLEGVVHLWSLDAMGAGDSERLDRALELGYESLLPLLQALHERSRGATVDVKMVSAGAQDVTGQETLFPEGATLAALARVASQEYENLRCGSFDLDAGPLLERTLEPPPADFERLVRELAFPTSEALVAFRGGRRWTSTFENVPLEPVRDASPLPERGVVLVTGGLGDVGYAMGAYLAKKFRARLALIGRTPFPPREEWERRAAQGGALARKIEKVRVLESLGAEVLVLQADVANDAEMRRALHAAFDRFGEIHGVIHAAGDLSPEGFGLIDQLETGASERQLAPKARGLLLLEQLLRDRPPAFWFLTSSLSVVLGGLGYAAYAASNALLDAYAAARRREGTSDWKVIDWDQWRFDASRPAGGGVRGSSLEALAMTAREGLATFEQVLHMSYPHRIVISTAPLEARLAQWVEVEVETSGDAPSDGAPAKPVAARRAHAHSHARPAAAGDYVAPRNETEEAIARIWQELLGIDRVGLHDDFFVLGGHSLFAARVISRLKEAFSVSLPLASVFDKPTVAGLAERIEAVRWAARKESSAEEPSGERIEVEL